MRPRYINVTTDRRTDGRTTYCSYTAHSASRGNKIRRRSADTMCDPPCCFKIAFMHRDLLTLTVYCSTFKARRCCMRLTYTVVVRASCGCIWMHLGWSCVVNLWHLTYLIVVAYTSRLYYSGADIFPVVFPSSHLSIGHSTQTSLRAFSKT